VTLSDTCHTEYFLCCKPTKYCDIICQSKPFGMPQNHLSHGQYIGWHSDFLADNCDLFKEITVTTHVLDTLHMRTLHLPSHYYV